MAKSFTQSKKNWPADHRELVTEGNDIFSKICNFVSQSNDRPKIMRLRNIISALKSYSMPLRLCDPTY